MNSKTMITQAGRDTASFVECGLEVNAECYAEEKVTSCDEEVLALVRKHGLTALLESLIDAAYGASEMHEETNDLEDMGPFRTRMFGRRLDAVVKTLR